MDKEIVKILSSYGCKYMADDYKEMIEEIVNFVKEREQAINFTDSSLQLENLKVNRFEVIDKIGRAYVNYCDRPLNIETSLQDNERTLKIFLDD